jgi:acetyl-CoA acetyltransferase
MSQTPLDALVFRTLQAVHARMNIDPALVDDICLGNVRDGNAALYTRSAALAAGFPSTCCASSSSRFCSSGLTATQHIATEIS